MYPVAETEAGLRDYLSHNVYYLLYIEQDLLHLFAEGLKSARDVADPFSHCGSSPSRTSRLSDTHSQRPRSPKNNGYEDHLRH